MTEINTLTYINTKDNAAVASTKPYTDNACDFNDVFETANKAYSKNETTDTQKVEYKEKEKPVEKKDKIEEKENNGNDENNKIDDSKSEKVEEKAENKVEDKSEDKTSDTKAENSDKTNVAEEVKQVIDSVKTAVKDAVETLHDVITGAQANPTQPTGKNAELIADAAQAINNAKESKQAEMKVQPKTQQVLLNLQTEETPVATTAQNTETATKTPVVQAQANIAVDANQKNSKNEIKEALEKSNLTQDLLDKTNAQIISVEKSQSSNNNLLNGNAQEQGVKIALENTMASTTQGGTVQTNFDKTINNIQEPKELSKSDILSQVNTKLEQFKDEGTTKITIILKPENLGKIHLELINGKDGLTASMTAENAQVKDLLDKSLESLKNSLGAQGVNVNNVTVKVAETQQPANDMFTFDQREFEQNSQQFQKKSDNTNSSEFAYEEDFVNTARSGENEELTQTTTSHNGQVDYKI